MFLYYYIYTIYYYIFIEEFNSQRSYLISFENNIQIFYNHCLIFYLRALIYILLLLHLLQYLLDHHRHHSLLKIYELNLRIFGSFLCSIFKFHILILFIENIIFLLLRNFLQMLIIIPKDASLFKVKFNCFQIQKVVRNFEKLHFLHEIPNIIQNFLKLN